MGDIDAMPMAEYLSWQEFYAIEPWGLSVHDATQAHLASILANVNRDSGKRPTPYSLSEFLIFAAPPPGPLAEPEEPVRVNGLTAEQHKLLMGFEALKKELDTEKG
ncbi:MAG: hypothetical protein NVSMB6_00030 [Burkholderiaceae bacterium]